MPENLKNVLLFMSSSGYLVPPSKDPFQEKLWIETWKRIDRFLPDLRADLQLEEPEPQLGAVPSSQPDNAPANPSQSPRTGAEEGKDKETAAEEENEGEEAAESEAGAKKE